MNALPYGLVLGMALTVCLGESAIGESVLRTTAGVVIRGQASWEPSGITLTTEHG
jgi:hypothetical protein